MEDQPSLRRGEPSGSRSSSSSPEPFPDLSFGSRQPWATRPCTCASSCRHGARSLRRARAPCRHLTHPWRGTVSASRTRLQRMEALRRLSAAAGGPSTGPAERGIHAKIRPHHQAPRVAQEVAPRLGRPHDMPPDSVVHRGVPPFPPAESPRWTPTRSPIPSPSARCGRPPHLRTAILVGGRDAQRRQVPERDDRDADPRALVRFAPSHAPRGQPLPRVPCMRAAADDDGHPLRGAACRDARDLPQVARRILQDAGLGPALDPPREGGRGFSQRSFG